MGLGSLLDVSFCASATVTVIVKPTPITAKILIFMIKLYLEISTQPLLQLARFPNVSWSSPTCCWLRPLLNRGRRDVSLPS